MYDWMTFSYRVARSVQLDPHTVPLFEFMWHTAVRYYRYIVFAKDID